MNGCVSGGLLSFGKYHAGALERSMKTLQEGIKRLDRRYRIQLQVKLSDEFLECGEKIPGFGHRYHREDPRALNLWILQKNMNVLEFTPNLL